MGRRLNVSLAAGAALLAAATAWHSLRAQTRVFATTKDGELAAEMTTAGSGWCQSTVTLTIRGKDDSFFTTGETDEQGRHGRFLLQKLLSVVRIGLEKECPQAVAVTFNGFVDDVFVYRGYASRDAAAGAWVLFDMPVALVEDPPTLDTGETVALATPSPTGANPAPVTAAAAPPPAPPPARREAIGECDGLAAHPDDPEKPKGVAGVSDDDLNAGAALRACDEALQAAPGTPRLQYQLARAALLYDRYADGVELMTDAAEAGHGGALAALGDFALYGVLDEEPDPETAKQLYQKAALAGFKPAAKLAKEIVANPKEDTRQQGPQEPEFHEAERMAQLLKGESLPGGGAAFARHVVYATNAIAGIKYQCPDAGLSWLSPFRLMEVVSKRMGGGSINGLMGALMLSEGNYPDLEQAAMDDGYALAFSKGCGSREVAAVQSSVRHTFE